MEAFRGHDNEHSGCLKCVLIELLIGEVNAASAFAVRWSFPFGRCSGHTFYAIAS
jgi:hypothetical protein